MADGLSCSLGAKVFERCGVSDAGAKLNQMGETGRLPRDPNLVSQAHTRRHIAPEPGAYAAHKKLGNIVS